ALAREWVLSEPSLGLVCSEGAREPIAEKPSVSSSRRRDPSDDRAKRSRRAALHGRKLDFAVGGAGQHRLVAAGKIFGEVPVRVKARNPAGLQAHPDGTAATRGELHRHHAPRESNRPCANSEMELLAWTQAAG